MSYRKRQQIRILHTGIIGVITDIRGHNITVESDDFKGQQVFHDYEIEYFPDTNINIGIIRMCEGDR